MSFVVAIIALQLLFTLQQPPQIVCAQEFRYPIGVVFAVQTLVFITAKPT